MKCKARRAVKGYSPLGQYPRNSLDKRRNATHGGVNQWFLRRLFKFPGPLLWEGEAVRFSLVPIGHFALIGDNRHTLRYTARMKPFRWNSDKNKALKTERNISFEVIALAIEADGLLDKLRHPNAEKYPNQSVLVVAFDNYVYLVPYVEEPDHYFLKTVIPSRKATRDYLLRDNPDEKT